MARAVAASRLTSAGRTPTVAEMCGRFSLLQPAEAVARHFEAVPSAALGEDHPRYNICPTQDIAVVRNTGQGREIVPMRWGFIPSWAKRLNDGPLLFNARSETLAEKPAFRQAARQRRCLIAASGFFEWHGDGADKQAYWVAPTDDGIVAFAGVWSRWQGPDGPVTSVAIVTIGANDTLRGIHPRMPLLIAPEGFGLWLGEQGHGAARLMRPVPESIFAVRRVGPAVNSNRADGPDLMTPVA